MIDFKVDGFFTLCVKFCCQLALRNWHRIAKIMPENNLNSNLKNAGKPTISLGKKAYKMQDSLKINRHNLYTMP